MSPSFRLSRVVRALILLAGIPALPAVCQSTVTTSRYTRLTHPPCKTTHVRTEGADSEQLCPGVGGYKLVLLDSDGRMSVTIVSPDGTKHPLDFWKNVTPQFSAIGKTAEWRISSDAPSALILPLSIQEDPNTSKSTPYRIVVKLTPQAICIVAKLPAADGVEAAHRAAGQMCPQP